MVNQATKNSAGDLMKDLKWLSEVIEARLSSYFGKAPKLGDPLLIKPPDTEKDETLYAGFLHYYKMTNAERLLLLLALSPHLQPQLLDAFFIQNQKTGRGYAEFGGIRGRQHGGFIPTGETAMFLLAGTDLNKRAEYLKLLSSDHFFSRHQILKLEPPAKGEPLLSGMLSTSDEIVDLLISGTVRSPDLSSDFPAKRIFTEMEWNNLVLNKRTAAQLDEIKSWMQHSKTLLEDWGFAKKFRKGYRCLFYGPPGTGKSLTASLLGKHFGKDVYRIDLSLVVSKYIGETEKNLSKIFDKAENKNWILFFDEADALFGKRTKVSDAHDRYANQEVSYLLQRIEDFGGVVILASNQKDNLDDAFTRRFEAIIHFPLPNAADRYAIWKNGFSEKSRLHKDVSLEKFARNHEISGGAIMNVIRYASLAALSAGTNVINQKMIEAGIKKELEKEGRTL